ncbi:hypothetical protein [Actinoplanes sp. NPDC049118]|uniref:hypothetical protein n=1 Tax=Actinoplanes sp. NPDC049118 TaxID=3155769 RepID=UPI0033C5B922
MTSPDNTSRAIRQSLGLPPVLLDQPRDPAGLLLQPQPLNPSRRLPLTQQPQDLIIVHQPVIRCHNRQTSTPISQVTQKETHLLSDDLRAPEIELNDLATTRTTLTRLTALGDELPPTGPLEITVSSRSSPR